MSFKSMFQGFDAKKAAEVLSAGADVYTSRQNDKIAKELNKINIKDLQYADAYIREANKGLDRLQRGGLPSQYNALLKDEEQRLTRQLVAQGYNPTESGHGAQTLQREMGALKAALLQGERDYYTGILNKANSWKSQYQANLRKRDPLGGIGGLSSAIFR
jgi:hypothetical protein